MGFGADWPSPQSDEVITSKLSVSSRSMSPSRPLPSVIRVRISSRRFVPMRQGTHFPQDSDSVNFRKYVATFTMQSVSSSTTMPPEPMMDPTLASDSKSTGVSMRSTGMQPPDGPPDWTAFSRFPPSMPPPMS